MISVRTPILDVSELTTAAKVKVKDTAKALGVPEYILRQFLEADLGSDRSKFDRGLSLSDRVIGLCDAYLNAVGKGNNTDTESNTSTNVIEEKKSYNDAFFVDPNPEVVWGEGKSLLQLIVDAIEGVAQWIKDNIELILTGIAVIATYLSLVALVSAIGLYAGIGTTIFFATAKIAIDTAIGASLIGLVTTFVKEISGMELNSWDQWARFVSSIVLSVASTLKLLMILGQHYNSLTPKVPEIPIPEFERYANKIADHFGVVPENAKNNNGFVIKIYEFGRVITVRIMGAGSGSRPEDYFRISIDMWGTYDMFGNLSSSLADTHMNLSDFDIASIIALIEKIINSLK